MKTLLIAALGLACTQVALADVRLQLSDQLRQVPVERAATLEAARVAVEKEIAAKARAAEARVVAAQSAATRLAEARSAATRLAEARSAATRLAEARSAATRLAAAKSAEARLAAARAAALVAPPAVSARPALPPASAPIARAPAVVAPIVNALDSASAPFELNALSAVVYDQTTGRALFAKNADLQTPIASITKLMTAMLVLDARQGMHEQIKITDDDRDTLKWTGSRLAVGSSYSRQQLLHLALIASDNRAAHALGRSYPGGMERFVASMNRMARALNLNDTVYVEPTGLSSGNRSTAIDLARLANHVHHNYPEIRQISASGSYSLGTQRVVVKKKNRKARVFYRDVAFNNTNRFTRADDWNIGLSKTGFINEAGHCLVMQANIAGRDTVIVLLDAGGNNRRAGDATRIKHWLESQEPARRAATPAPASRT